MVLVPVPLVVAMLGQSGVVIAVPTTEVAGGFGLATEVGLDRLLAGGILGGDVQEVPRHARVSRPSVWMSASQVMPQMKALIMSVSVIFGSSLRFLEKHCMYSQRVSSALCLQLQRSHEFLGRVYVPWK
jgi:hypothetical protein